MQLYVGMGLFTAGVLLFLVASALPEGARGFSGWILKSEFTALVITIFAAFGIALVTDESMTDGSVGEAVLALAGIVVATVVLRRFVLPRRRPALAVPA